MASKGKQNVMYEEVISTVDSVLMTLKDDALKLVVLRREEDPDAGMLALPGGVIHAQEDVDARGTAERVLRVKCGIVSPYLEQLYTFSGLKRDPRRWSLSVAYFALVPATVLETPESSGRIQLIDLENTPDVLPRDVKLAFDHAAIVRMACSRLRDKSQYSSMPCHLLGDSFTVFELRRAYEIVMGEPLERSSFRRKLLEMDFLEPVKGKMKVEGRSRPAQVYRLRRQFRDSLRLVERGF